METRSTPVPDGLDGVRVDAGLARLFGFYRTQAAEIAEAGGVQQNGLTLGKADKLRAEALLTVEWEEKR